MPYIHPTYTTPGLSPNIEAAAKGIKRKISKTGLLTARPPLGDVDGENGFFLATPSVVEYLDYEVGKIYRQDSRITEPKWWNVQVYRWHIQEFREMILKLFLS